MTVRKVVRNRKAQVTDAPTLPLVEELPRIMESEERNLAVNRTHDRTKSWKIYGMPLGLWMKVINEEEKITNPSVERNLNFPITHYISNRMQNHNKENPFRVAELGCGPGTALNTLKNKFGESIYTVGTILALPFGNEKNDIRGVDELLVGELKDIKPSCHFDLIYSAVGALFYTHLKRTWVRKTFEWLDHGGAAVLETGSLEKKEVTTILKDLKSYGVKQMHYSGNDAVLQFVKR
jgi:SAM-dependent methyltransferase